MFIREVRTTSCGWYVYIIIKNSIKVCLCIEYTHNIRIWLHKIAQYIENAICLLMKVGEKKTIIILGRTVKRNVKMLTVFPLTYEVVELSGLCIQAGQKEHERNTLKIYPWSAHHAGYNIVDSPTKPSNYTHVHFIVW